MKENHDVVAQLVRDLRKRLNIGQRRLAELCATQQPVISMIEGSTPGKGMTPTLAYRMLSKFSADLKPEELELLESIAGGGRRTKQSVIVYLPSEAIAPQTADFLKKLSKASPDEMLDMTDDDLRGWLCHAFGLQECK